MEGNNLAELHVQMHTSVMTLGYFLVLRVSHAVYFNNYISQVAEIPVALLVIPQDEVIPQNDHITVVFFPGFQLATGKKGRFLYDLVRCSRRLV